MRNKTLIALFIAAITLISCKDDKSKDTPVAEEKVDTTFTITFNMIVPKDDNFQIYFNGDGSDSFLPEDYVEVAVKGSDSPQDITFKLPVDVLPASLRFDLGDNKDQGEIKINDFRLKYLEKVFAVKDVAFINYFWSNAQIEYIKEKAIAKPKPSNDPYDPIFMATEALKIELKKIAK
jgi:hypothetical protein